MKQYSFKFFTGVLLSVLIYSCANRGNPTGGIKDEMPPVIVKSTPKNYTTNFKGNEVRILFDEYVRIKDLSSQLIISPPMSTAPDITPLSGASKEIKIRINDTLLPNTTYSFNFGNSIVDHNEENPFPYFKYVISTGNYIDSLKVYGKVKEALLRKLKRPVIINLYEVNKSYTDSVVFLEKAKYTTNLLENTSDFTIENVKEGRYKLVAIRDVNKDNKFQSVTDGIGFYKDEITVSKDSTFYDIELFEESQPFSSKYPRLVSGNKISFGYKGNAEGVTVNLKENKLKAVTSRLIKAFKKDTINVFYKSDVKQDSLNLMVSKSDFKEDYWVNLRALKKDSLKVIVVKSNIGINESFKLNGTVPFEKIDPEKITIMDKDSVVVPFTYNLDKFNNNYEFKFKKDYDNNYKVTVLPKGLIDLFGQTTDTLKFSAKTAKQNSFGNLRLNIKEAKSPVIVQLVNDKDDVKYSDYLKASGIVDFLDVNPGKYFLRVIHDTNKNGVYDSGIFLSGQQSERVSHDSKVIEIRASWDEIREFTLK